MTTSIALQLISAYGKAGYDHPTNCPWNIYDLWVKEFPNEPFPRSRNVIYSASSEDDDIAKARERLYSKAIEQLAAKIDA